MLNNFLLFKNHFYFLFFEPVILFASFIIGLLILVLWISKTFLLIETCSFLWYQLHIFFSQLVWCLFVFVFFLWYLLTFKSFCVYMVGFIIFKNFIVSEFWSIVRVFYPKIILEIACAPFWYIYIFCFCYLLFIWFCFILYIWISIHLEFILPFALVMR